MVYWKSTEIFGVRLRLISQLYTYLTAEEVKVLLGKVKLSFQMFIVLLQSDGHVLLCWDIK